MIAAVLADAWPVPPAFRAATVNRYDRPFLRFLTNSRVLVELNTLTGCATPSRNGRTT